MASTGAVEQDVCGVDRIGVAAAGQQHRGPPAQAVIDRDDIGSGELTGPAEPDGRSRRA
jgi:hypothetical protein